MSERMYVNQLLQQMRDLKSQSQAFFPNDNMIDADRRDALAPNRAANVNGPDFSTLFSSAIDKVNDVQQNSSALGTAYMNGDKSVGITDVMIARQKASVAFEDAVQVRNKRVEAYKDIMNMPI